MFCPACGASVADGAKFCNTCGKNLAETTENNATPDASAASEPAFAAPSFEKKPKPRKNFLKWLIPVIAVAIIAIVALLLSDCFAGDMKEKFSTNEEYLEYVEKKAFEGYSDSFAGAIDAYNDFANGKNAAQTEISLQVKQDILDALTDAIGLDIDLGWINKTVLKGTTSIGDGLVGNKIALSVADQTLLDLSLIMDENALYLALPNLGEKYLKVDVNVTTGADSAYEYESGKLTINLLESDISLDIIDKYIDIVFDGIEGVEKTTETLVVSDVSQEVTALSLTVDLDMLAKILTDVLGQLKTDKDAEALILSIGEFLVQQGAADSADELYGKFVAAVDELLAQIETEEYENETVFTLIAYVDDDHNIVGQKLEVYDDEILYYATATDGNRFATEFTVTDVVTVKGVGTKDGKLQDAEYELTAAGQPILNVEISDYDPEALASGALYGKFVIKPAAALYDLVDIDSSVETVIRTLDLGLSVESNGGRESGKLSIGVISGEETLVGIMISTSKVSAETVALPSEEITYEIDEAVQWIKSMDFEKLVTAMKNAGLPSELVSAVNSILSLIKIYG